MQVAGAVLEQAVPVTDAGVAAREEDAGATQPELREQVAHTHRIIWRNFVLFGTEIGAYRLRDVRLPEHEVEPVEEIIALGTRAAGAVEYMLGRVRHGRSVLDIETRLGAWVSRVVPSAADLHDVVCCRGPVGAIFIHK